MALVSFYSTICLIFYLRLVPCNADIFTTTANATEEFLVRKRPLYEVGFFVFLASFVFSTFSRSWVNSGCGDSLLTVFRPLRLSGRT